jgi:hypothetical protein
MRVDTTFKEVDRRYAQQLKELEAQRLKSKAKAAADPLNTFSFYFNWGERIQAQSFNDVVTQMQTGVRKADPYADAILTDDRVAARCNRIAGMTVSAVKGRCTLAVPIPDQPIPQEIVDAIIVAEQAGEEDRIRMSNMTAEEREEEVEKLIGQLAKGGGMFAVFGMPARKP